MALNLSPWVSLGFNFVYCRLDQGGTRIVTFMDSFIASFIFMESADNWESLVYNAYKVSKAGAILLFVVAIFGTFFLVTLATLRVTT